MLNGEGNQLGTVESGSEVDANRLTDLELVAQISAKVDGSVGPRIRKCYSCEGHNCSMAVIDEADVHYDDRAGYVYGVAARI